MKAVEAEKAIMARKKARRELEVVRKEATFSSLALLGGEWATVEPGGVGTGRAESGASLGWQSSEGSGTSALPRHYLWGSKNSIV